MSVAAPSFEQRAGHVSEMIKLLSLKEQNTPIVQFNVDLGGVKVSYTSLGKVDKYGDTRYSTGGENGSPAQTWCISHGPLGTLYTRDDPSSRPVITTSQSQYPSRTSESQDQSTDRTQSEQTSQSQNTTQSGSLHPYYKYHEWAEQDDKRAKFANLCARRMMDAGTARKTDKWAEITTSICKDIAEKYSHRTSEANTDWMSDMSRDVQNAISGKTGLRVNNCEPSDMRNWISQIEGDETRLNMFRHAGNLTDVLERFEEKARKNPTASNDEVTASVESSMTGLWGTSIERDPFGGDMGVSPDRPSFLSQATSMGGSVVKGLLQPWKYPSYIWSGAKYLGSSAPERVANPFFQEGSDRLPPPPTSDSSAGVFSSAVTSAQERDANPSDATTAPTTSRWTPKHWIDKLRGRRRNPASDTSGLVTSVPSSGM